MFLGHKIPTTTQLNPNTEQQGMRIKVSEEGLIMLRSYGPDEYGELPTHCWRTPPGKLRAFI